MAAGDRLAGSVRRAACEVAAAGRLPRHGIGAALPEAALRNAVFRFGCGCGLRQMGKSETAHSKGALLGDLTAGRGPVL
eukprot:4407814-Pyramimonas_sp.AAC.1